ncbi:ROK family protein [Phycicoccus duodecadis]|uniref:Putative NBD/HSP70 family sugar kinase n=1 Tax=Phycicoccus duodecadis TaxID=173053 RepID=A0A2N3YKX8_9MICO|nr:ROK family protein [Phycicoccus duodecadis]PKW27517.1 putative NBD/HSP70 family sugar kinase [Phycicoccus duodecadis]
MSSAPPPPARWPGRPAGGASRATQSSVREANLALVAATVCASAEPVSRAEVAGRTAMTRSTVSRLVDELVGGGVLDELEPGTTTGRGRPATPLTPGARVAALGLQVDAGFLAARVLDLRGRAVAERVAPGSFVGSEPAGTLARLRRLAEEVVADVPPGVRLAGAGLALPGLVSPAGTELLLAPNLGWSDLGVADLPVVAGMVPRLGNEADLAARTVAQVAPGRPGHLTDFVYLSGEVGIGGSVVLGGAGMPGRHGWAGEIGHVTVDPAGPPCPCGSTGCLERYVGREALLSAAGLPPTATGRDLADAARAGDPTTLAALRRAAWALGVVLAGVVNVLDIPAVVVGGLLAEVGDLLRPELEGHLRTRALSARWVAPVVSSGGEIPAAGASGAALRELAAVLAHPAAWVAAAS